MDKRFEKVIEKLENQAASAIETNKKLEKVFKEVNVAQKGTDEKLVRCEKIYFSNIVIRVLILKEIQWGFQKCIQN